MSWKKYFTEYKPENNSGQVSPISGTGQVGPARTNYSSFLPDVYSLQNETNQSKYSFKVLVVPLTYK